MMNHKAKIVNTADYWHDKSNKECDNGDFKAGLISIDKSLELNSDDYMVWYRKGVILQELGFEEEVEDCARRSIDLQGTYCPSWVLLGVNLYERKRYLEALEYMEKSIEICKEPNPMILTIMANICLAYDLEKAVKYSEWALKLEPEWEEAMVILDEATHKISK